MTEKSKLSPSQWIDLLAKEELPAITSIASLLDKFSNDDISSIPKLSKVILHDQALSSCLLRVANSSHRSPIKKITTVSRAAIVLGIHAVKNICLTAKILDGLLKSKNLAPPVYDRLMMLMANAFYAGLLARIMVPNYDENTQEEVYLAAMLYHIGETSFWSTGIPLTEKLIQRADMPVADFQQYCASKTGVKFKDLSIGLAKTWNLGDMLVKSLDRPESRTIEMKIISYANQLTSAIASPPKNKAQFDQLLTDISQLMNTDVRTLKAKIERTRTDALELLNSYGAEVLESYIKPLPKSDDFESTLPQEAEVELNKEQALLRSLQLLTRLTKNHNSVNSYLAQALKDAVQIFGLDRCSFWVLNSEKTQIETRMTFDSDGQPMVYNRTILLDQGDNVMGFTLRQESSVLINDYTQAKWRNFMTVEIERLINKGAICISPVKIGDKAIGLITTHTLDKSKKISPENFSQLSFLLDHLNMCLSRMAVN